MFDAKGFLETGVPFTLLLLADLETVLPKEHLDKIWEMIC